ncbi:MAG: 4Fe-4S binding protein [Chloroflexi bacterium]|nr:4Fe-4S binding protein [Chloroflexota bacterium]
MANVIPEIDEELCNLCGDCVAACPQQAVTIENNRLVLDEERCAYCGDCEDLCPTGAIAVPYEIVVVEEPKPHPPSGDAMTAEEKSDGATSDRSDR